MVKFVQLRSGPGLISLVGSRTLRDTKNEKTISLFQATKIWLVFSRMEERWERLTFFHVEPGKKGAATPAT